MASTPFSGSCDDVDEVDTASPSTSGTGERRAPLLSMERWKRVFSPPSSLKFKPKRMSAGWDEDALLICNTGSTAQTSTPRAVSNKRSLNFRKLSLPLSHSQKEPTQLGLPPSPPSARTFTSSGTNSPPYSPVTPETLSFPHHDVQEANVDSEATIEDEWTPAPRSIYACQYAERVVPPHEDPFAKASVNARRHSVPHSPTIRRDLCEAFVNGIHSDGESAPTIPMPALEPFSWMGGHMLTPPEEDSQGEEEAEDWTLGLGTDIPKTWTIHLSPPRHSSTVPYVVEHHWSEDNSDGEGESEDGDEGRDGGRSAERTLEFPAFRSRRVRDYQSSVRELGQ
jgi:hypothetical protein